ncbi:MAG: oligosaccharide flippase family protein [bacterium]
MASGLRNFNSVLISKILMLILALGTQIILARFLGPEGRGSYAVCIMLAGLLNIIFIPACDVAIVYFVSSGRMNLSEGLIYAFIYGIIGSAVAISAGFILIQFPLTIFEKADLSSFYLAYISIPFSLFALVFSRLLTATGDFLWFSFSTILIRLLQLLLVLFLIGVFSLGVKGALFAVIISAMITILFSLVILNRKYDLRFVKPQMGKLVNMIHYGLRYYIGKISNLANVKIGTIILSFFATRAQIGFFDIAVQLGTKTMLIPDALITVLTPKVAKYKESTKDLVAMCSRLTGIISFFMLLVLTVFANQIVITLFSSEFLLVVPLLRVIAIGVLIRSISKVFVPYLLGTDHPGIISIGVSLGTIINLVLLWVLLPVIGLIAGGLAITAGYIVSSAIIIVAFKNVSRLGFKEIFKVKRSDFSFLRLVTKKGRFNQ